MISYRNVFHVLGILFFIFSALMLIPALVDLSSSSDSSTCFIMSAVFSCFIGGLLFFANQNGASSGMNIREKILLILLFWITVPFISALPFTLSPFQISFINGLFESASALTTTGSTVIYDIKSLSDGFLLWRSLLEISGAIWFVLSCVCIFSSFKINQPYLHNDIITNNSDKELVFYHLKFILAFYIGAIFLSSFILVGSGLSAIDSICYSIGAISSGGLISDNTYHLTEASHRLSWVLSILMFLSGCSITFLRNLKNVIYYKTNILEDRQFATYVYLTCAGIIFVAGYIFFSQTDIDFFSVIEKAVLIITSSITTTGLCLDEKEIFAPAIETFVYIFNFIGGSSGSCTGGMKIFRIMMIFILIKSYLIRLINRNAIHIPTYNGRKIEEFEITGLFSYFASFLILSIFFTTLFSASGYNFSKAFGCVITTMNNNGPYIGLHKATANELAAFAVSAKSILITAMISGRVEFYLFFVILLRSFWRK